MGDILPLNDRWPENLPYQKQSLVLSGSEKPGHSGTQLLVDVRVGPKLKHTITVPL